VETPRHVASTLFHRPWRTAGTGGSADTRVNEASITSVPPACDLRHRSPCGWWFDSIAVHHQSL